MESGTTNIFNRCYKGARCRYTKQLGMRGGGNNFESF